MKSKSEKYLENISALPQVSSLMSKSVSSYRRTKLAEEVEQGLFKDGSPNKNTSSANDVTPASYVTASVGLKKNAQVVSSNAPSYRGMSGDTVKQSPEVYSPLWLNSNLSLPRDRATINAWCRAFFALNPFVHNAISLHSTYPISKLNIKCANKEVEKFFNEMIEEIDLMNVCVQIAQEYWLLGEAFVYAELDETKGKWSRLLIQNPDNMVVKRTVVADEPAIYLRPDENLKRIISSNKPQDIEERKKINDYIVQTVKRNENILLPSLNISHIARRISPYEIRGSGLPVCIFRQLYLFDILRESKFAQAHGFINPLTLVKIGDADFKPTLADIENYRQIFESAQYDKDFKIFTHNGVDVQIVGRGQGIYDVSNDITQLVKEIYVGLMVPSVLMDGGSDTTYANGGVALDVLRQRYMQFRNMMSSWLRRKIFAPISHIQGFYNYKKRGDKSEKELIIPEVDWNHMSLFDAGDYINTLVALTQGEGDQKRASLHSLYRSMGLEWIDEKRKIRRETIDSEILKKEKQSLEKMDLNQLRALDENDEIPDLSQEESPSGGGESPPPPGGEGGLPGVGDMGGLGAPPPEPPPV